MNLEKTLQNLTYKDGIWFGEDTAQISYPASGNENYFQVEDRSFWFRHRNRCIEYLLQLFPPNKYFFDIGGGNGFVSKGIQNAGLCEVVLVEPGIVGILNAKKRGLKHLVCSDIQQAHFTRNSLPAVGLFDVVEHIADDRAFLAEISSLIEPNGYVFITVPTYSFLFSNDDRDAGHFRRYTKTSMNKLLTENNFEICFSSYIFVFLIAPIFLLKTIPSLLFKRSAPPKTIQSDHAPKIGSSLIDRLLDLEFFFFKNLWKIPFGTSYVVVGRKKAN